LALPLTEWLGRIPALGSKTLKMNFSRCGSPSLLAPAARPAEHCDCPHIAFGCFVPPLLLGLCPDLGDAARLAVEREVYVVTALDELRRAVASGWAEIGGVHKNVLLRQLALNSVELALSFARQFNFLRAALQATAFQDWRASRAGRLHAA